MIAARQLMHSCEIYNECMCTIQSGVQQQQRKIEFVGNADTSQGKAISAALSIVMTRVEDDRLLLESIKREVNDIITTAPVTGIGVVLSAIHTKQTGRDEKIQKLSAELMSRVPMLTALMMKDVWKVNKIYKLTFRFICVLRIYSGNKCSRWRNRSNYWRY